MKTIALLLAAASCCLLAAPAYAENRAAPVTVTATRSDPDTIRVTYGDLSLATATDAGVLRARVERATRRKCGELYDGGTPSQRWACYDIAWRVAEPQVAAAIERAGTAHNLAGRAVVLRFAGH